MTRYEDLLNALPSGSEYANEGYVLPFLDAPQQFLFETDAANTVFGVFVDDSFRFTITTDAQGVALVELTLGLGPHVITLQNDVTARNFNSYVTVRDYAVWYAALADQYNQIDGQVTSTENGTRLLVADSVQIEDTQGKVLAQLNDLGYVTDAYRTVLQGLRQAYRQYGGKVTGVYQAVESFTNVAPFFVPLDFTPVWYLGSLNDFEFSVQGDLSLPNINARTLDNIATISDDQTNPPSITQPIKAGPIKVIYSGTWIGGSLTLVGTATDGSSVTEIVPSSPGNTVVTSRSFATITSITNNTPTGIATGSATIGDGGNFITIDSITGPVAITPTLFYRDVSGVPFLSTSASSPFTPIPGDGNYAVTFQPTTRVFDSLNTENFTFTGEDRFLYINVNGRGRLQVEMASGASETAAQVAARINVVSNADVRYTADIAVAQADGSVAITSGNLSDDDNFIRIEEGPANGARRVFGVPRLSAQAPAAIGSGATTITPVTSELTTVVPPYKVRIGRNGESGTATYSLSNVTISNASGRFADAGLAASGLGDYLAIGDFFQVTTAFNNNEGFHTVVGRVDADTVRIRGQDPATTFTPAANDDAIIHILGEVNTVTAVDTGTGELTLENPTTREYNQSVSVDNFNWQIEVLELPYQTTPTTQLFNQGIFNVTVDQDYKPLADTSDTLSLTRSNLPDGWVSNAAATAVDQYGYMERFRIALSEGADNLTFEKTFPVVPGLPYRVTFWVQTGANPTCNYAINIDGDTGTDTVIDFVPRLGENPQAVTRVFNTDSTQTEVRVQLEHTTGTPGDITIIEKVVFEQSLEPTLFLGRGTIVRADVSEALDRILYYWSPDALTDTEDTAVNFHITAIKPAHVTVDTLDVSEYDGTGEPLNVIGVFDDADWLSATLVNMEVVAEVPGRITYARPTQASAVTGEVLTVDGLGQATLSEPSTNVGPTFPAIPNDSTLLQRDGVPVPNTADASGTQPYVFLSNQQLDIDPTEIVANAVYTLDYAALIQAETPVLDLGANFADYLWLSSMYAWRRTANALGDRQIARGVTFGANSQATLAFPSDQDKTTSVLTVDDGSESTTVPEAQWSYIDNQTIQINPQILNSDNVYTLTYQSLFNQISRDPSFVLEIRSATTAGAVTGATYATINPNEFIDNTLRYHQLRATFTGVDGTDDLRLHGLGLRGINVFGANANAPGIILP